MLKYIKEMAARIAQTMQGPSRRITGSPFYNTVDQEMIDVVNEVNNTGRPIPDPKGYLGEEAAKVIRWTHPDDLFVTFDISHFIGANNFEAFMHLCKTGRDENDNSGVLTYSKISVDAKELTQLMIAKPAGVLTEGHYAYVVRVDETENAYGLFLIDETTYIDSLRRSYGMTEAANDEDRYVLQYMALTAKVIKDLEVRALQWVPMKVEVNFAEYEADEELDSFKEIPTNDTINLSQPA